MIHLSPDLLFKIEAAEKDCWTTYLSNIQKVPENPLGIEISSIGRSTAFLMRVSDSLFFNKALGFHNEHIEYIDPLLEFYHSNNKACTVEIIPLPEHKELQLAIARKGLYNSDFTMMLYKDLNEGSNSFEPKYQIEPVNKEDSEILAEVHVAGFEFQGEDAQREYLMVKEGYNSDKFKCFLAKEKGEILGTGALFMHKDVGVLFGGATIPEHRGKGCQRYLLYHRIKEAINLGCTLLISHTNLYTPSQRNLERVGFKLAYNRARWTDYPI